MVVPLGPGKFYGSSLPRPYIYTNPRFNSERVDPPVPFTDSLLSWAHDAHWSMGGLSFKRLRLQGKIEGNIKRLKAEKEKIIKKTKINQDSPLKTDVVDEEEEVGISTPRAPIGNKRKRMILEEEEEEEVVMAKEKTQKRKVGRKLKDDFDRVANENGFLRKECPKLDDEVFTGKMKRASESLIGMRTRASKAVEGEGVKGKERKNGSSPKNSRSS